MLSKNRASAFNVQACLAELKQYEEVEVLEKLAVDFHKEGMNDFAVESLLHCLNTSRVSANQALIGVSIVEICSANPHHWSNIFSILRCVRNRVSGQNGAFLSYVWNSFIKVSLSSGKGGYRAKLGEGECPGARDGLWRGRTRRDGSIALAKFFKIVVSFCSITYQGLK